ncbi:type II secretion system protein [Vibrio mediterranei]|uniref:type II secretion system protein n=1 Tax=Vibrio mediterranei TaxID=689 RepID=UPI00406785E1
MNRKNKGFTLIEVSIVIVLFTIASIYGIRWIQSMARDAKAQVVASRVEYVMDAIDRYYINRVTIGGNDPLSMSSYPGSITALESSGYLPVCSPADVQSGLCIDYKFLPFGSGVSGTLIGLNQDMDSGNPVMRVSFPLAGVTDTALRYSIINAVSMIPGFAINSSDVVTITMHRPGQMVQMEHLVALDGSRQMTSDWDFGDKDLSNVRNLSVTQNLSVTGDVTANRNLTVTGLSTLSDDATFDGDALFNNTDIMNPRYIIDVNDMTIEGMTDRTVVTGLRSTGSVSIENSFGKPVSKPQCPGGYTPSIEVWTIAVGYTSVLIDPSNTQVWYIDEGSNWRIHFRVNTQVAGQTTREWTYQGVVGYTTWCGIS